MEKKVYLVTLSNGEQLEVTADAIKVASGAIKITSNEQIIAVFSVENIRYVAEKSAVKPLN